MLKKFCSYYKPHMKLFLFDLLCALLLSVCNLVYPLIAKYIIEELAGQIEKINLILALGGLLFFIYIIKAILNFIIQYWGHIVGVRIQGDMRKEMFEHLQQLPFAYFDDHKTGTIMSRLINDLMDISELAHHGPEDIFIATITLIGSCILMIISVDPWLTLIIFSVVPFIIFYAIFTRKGMRNAFTKMREETGKINAQVESSVSGIRVSKAYVTEKYENEKFAKRNEKFKKARSIAYKQMGIFGSGMTFFTDFLYLIALVSGGIFYSKNYIDGAEFTALILYINNIIMPIRTIISIFEQIQSGMTGFARFMEVLNCKKEEDYPNAIDLDDIKEGISFNDVSFSYITNELDSEDSFVLSHLTFKINKGTTVALVGPSGGGKTTICHLLPRFYEINSGDIKIDGVNIKDLSRENIHDLFTMVLQDTWLFNGTVKENIVYNNENVTDEEVIDVCKKVGVHHFIKTLPNGYDSVLSDIDSVSSGQRQLLTIARGMIDHKPLLILDEATSNVDTRTEELVQKAMDKLSEGKTSFIIAHRLSTIKNADLILVMKDGNIIEQGNHDELIKENGFYANLYNSQFDKAE